MKTKIEKILLQMCLMDDTFMTVALDGNTEAISHIISTVLQRKVNAAKYIGAALVLLGIMEWMTCFML